MTNPSMTTPSNESIKHLFDEISPQYDKFNRSSSLGRDAYWRMKAAEPIKPGMRVLDVGTGTGDLAFLALKKIEGNGEVVGLDFSSQMLQLAEEKRKAAKLDKIKWIAKGAESIPFEDKLYDAVVSAFVMRNLYNNIDSILHGIFKCLNSDGVLSFVDLTEQENKMIRFCSRVYMKTIVTFWGKKYFASKFPVQYLQGSMQRFFKAKEFISLLKQVGFVDVKAKSYWCGAVTHYTGRKP